MERLALVAATILNDLEFAHLCFAREVELSQLMPDKEVLVLMEFSQNRGFEVMIVVLVPRRNCCFFDKTLLLWVLLLKNPIVLFASSQTAYVAPSKFFF
jgi:hypothetical protein